MIRLVNLLKSLRSDDLRLIEEGLVNGNNSLIIFLDHFITMILGWMEHFFYPFEKSKTFYISLKFIPHFIIINKVDQRERENKQMRLKGKRKI